MSVMRRARELVRNADTHSESSAPLTASAGGPRSLVNQAPPVSATLDRLPAVSGITVNTVHGHESSIAAVTERYAPQVESMEGAAFMYACLAFGQQFAQIRAVSNRVERRNRDAWKLSDAVANLGATTLRMLSEL